MTTNSLYCYGLYSCAFINNISMAGGWVYCNGELSCFGSTIIFPDSDDRLYCYGVRSCAELTLYSYASNYFNGYLSAQNATLYSMSSSSYYYFYDVSSGDGATIVCQSGHVCTVYCFSNACNNLILNCSDCILISLSCGGEASGVCHPDMGCLLYIISIARFVQRSNE